MGRTTESLDALKTALEKGYMDITHIEKGSLIEREIEQTGVAIYEE